MTNISQTFIEKRLIEIRDEYDALEVKPFPVPKSLIRFLALADVVGVRYKPEDIEKELDHEIKSLTPIEPCPHCQAVLHKTADGFYCPDCGADFI